MLRGLRTSLSLTETDSSLGSNQEAFVGVASTATTRPCRFPALRSSLKLFRSSREALLSVISNANLKSSECTLYTCIESLYSAAGAGNSYTVLKVTESKSHRAFETRYSVQPTSKRWMHDRAPLRNVSHLVYCELGMIS